MIVVWGRRLIVAAMLAWLVYALAFWAPSQAAGDPPPITTTATTGTTPAVPPVIVVATYQGRSARSWHDRYLAQLQRTRSLRKTTLARPNVTEAIDLACTIYGNCATLWRRARCESHLYRYAQNASGASGLLQFLPSTWRSTPFARFSVFSPYANALAAGWMITHGRGGEWVCQ